VEHYNGDNLNTTQTPECTKDKYNVKIIKKGVSPKVPPTAYIGRRMKGRRSKGDERIIRIIKKVKLMTLKSTTITYDEQK
jgi:hypothetical protein